MVDKEKTKSSLSTANVYRLSRVKVSDLRSAIPEIQTEIRKFRQIL